MRRFGLALVLACTAQPAVADARLFDEFKKFCIDTGADPQAIRQVAEAAGGVAGPPRRLGATFTFMIASWQFKDFIIEAGTAHAPLLAPRPAMALPARPAMAFTDCVLTGLRLDRDSAARLDQWVGVPREKVSASYTFLVRDGKHLPAHLSSNNAPELLKSGYLWTLQVGGLEAGGLHERDGVTLTHYLTP